MLSVSKHAAAAASLVQELLIRDCSAVVFPKYIDMLPRGHVSLHVLREGAVTLIATQTVLLGSVHKIFRNTYTGLSGSVVSKDGVFMF